jgi:hypothetical protein
MIGLPNNDSLFKCHSCRTYFDKYEIGGLPIFMALAGKVGFICPECKSESTELLCKVDGYSLALKINGHDCRHGTLISGTDLCPVCRMPMCPECFNHTVISLSRVTGYMSDISGWNEAKKQELSDRKRYSF